MDCEEGETIEFRLGELVRHSKFGLGRIKEVNSSRNACHVIVHFTTRGSMTLDMKYAKLEKID